MILHVIYHKNSMRVLNRAQEKGSLTNTVGQYTEIYISSCWAIETQYYICNYWHYELPDIIQYVIFLSTKLPDFITNMQHIAAYAYFLKFFSSYLDMLLWKLFLGNFFQHHISE